MSGEPAQTPNLASAGKDPPNDRGNLVYWNLFYQGICSHVPWNVLLAGHKFFKLKLVQVPQASDFLSHFTIIFMAVKYASLLLSIFALKKIDPNKQVTLSTAGNCLTFLLLTVICCTDLLGREGFYIAILTLVLFASLFCAIIEAGIFLITGHFPARYIQAFIAGHGVGGFVVISVNLASYFLANDSYQDAKFAIIYFSVTSILLLVSLILFIVLQSNSFYKHYNVTVQRLIKEKAQLSQQKENKFKKAFQRVSKSISNIAFSFLIMAGIAFIIFPLFIFQTQSTKLGTSKETWFHRDIFNNFALLLANTFDMIGKLIPLLPRFSFRNGPYVRFALGQIVFIPLFLFGNFKIEPYRLPLKPFLADDVLFFFLVSASAMMLSYLSTVAMMWAPERVEAQDRSMVIVVLIVYGAVGFAIGMTLSMGGRALLIHYAK